MQKKTFVMMTGHGKRCFMQHVICGNAFRGCEDFFSIPLQYFFILPKYVFISSISSIQVWAKWCKMRVKNCPCPNIYCNHSPKLSRNCVHCF